MNTAYSTHVSERNGQAPSVRVLPGVRGIAAGLYHLLVADLALAQSATLRAVLHGAAALIFAATVWFLFVGAAVMGLVYTGIAWPWAFLIIAVAALLLCALTVVQARKYLKHTTLKATRRQIDALFDSESPDTGGVR